MKVSRPIIMIGMPRSGTTAIFETLALHEDVAWFSHQSGWFPRIGVPMAIAVRLCGFSWCRRLQESAGTRHHKGLGRLWSLVPAPGECYPLWKRWCGNKFLEEYLIDVTATRDECRRVQKAVHWVLRLQGKSRFVGKITGPSRIGYIRSIFPDAFFIHIIRDGRAVVNSLLNVNFWKAGSGLDRPWWAGGSPDGWKEEWENFGRSPIALAAIQWRTVLEVAQREREQLAPDHYWEIRYEDFVADPRDVTDRFLAKCGLSPSRCISEYVSQPGRFRNMNYKYVERFSRDEIHMMDRIMGDWLDRYGYARGTL